MDPYPPNVFFLQVKLWLPHFTSLNLPLVNWNLFSSIYPFFHTILALSVVDQILGFATFKNSSNFFFYFDKTTRCSTFGMIPLKCTYNKLDKKRIHTVYYTLEVLVYKILTLIDRCLPRLWLKKFFNRFTHQSKSSNEWKSSLRALRTRRTEA